MSHKTHKELGSPFSNLRTLTPSGMLSTCTSHEYSSVAESRASPVFRQLGHLRFSTQQSRSIYNMHPGRSVFPLTSAAVARPLTSPLRYRFSADRGRHIRGTETWVVPCRRETAPGS